MIESWKNLAVMSAVWGCGNDRRGRYDSHVFVFLLPVKGSRDACVGKARLALVGKARWECTRNKPR